MRYLVFLVLLGTSMALTPARAADMCTAVALRDVPALEDPTSILAKGEIDEAVTQYRVNKKTGQTSFCSHGGYCYPTQLSVGGKTVEALRLTNCAVSKTHDPAWDDEDYTIYGVDVVRSAMSPNELRYEDLDNRFLEMGLCSACASNVAEYYMKRPGSRCTQLAKSALEGNPVATKELVDFPRYCEWH